MVKYKNKNKNCRFCAYSATSKAVLPQWSEGDGSFSPSPWAAL